jgi:hypothetical protein
MKKLIFIIIALALVAVGLVVWKGGDNAEPTQSAPVSDLQKYSNPTYGFAIEYPKSLTPREYSAENVVFGTTSGEMMNGVVEVRVVNVEAKAGESFMDAATRELQNLCAADGPNASYNCTGVEKVTPFKTASGLSGISLYLKGELTNLKTKSKTAIGKGPYFLFAAKSSATGSRIIVVHPPLNKSAEESDSVAIRKVAETLVINAPQEADAILGDYLREKISELSPKKESLGGKFYITALEAHGGAGTVSYEDGHSAYTADFKYSVDSKGKISVTNFKIRE